MANVIVINTLDVPKSREKQALAIWDKFAAHFEKQPGYVSVKLHRALNPDAQFHLVTVAEWASADDFMAALANPEFQEIADSAMDYASTYRGLYEVIRS